MKLYLLDSVAGITRGIYVRTASWSGLAEEAGSAYKDIDEVIDATERGDQPARGQTLARRKREGVTRWMR